MPLELRKAGGLEYREDEKLQCPSSSSPHTIMEKHYRQADLQESSDRESIIALLDGFSREISPENPLSEQARKTLVQNLHKHPTTLVFLAEAENTPVGLAVCFLGFSTFANKPLLNLHDFYVTREWQGKGIGKEFLSFLEEQAKARGCCKVTLEVYDSNSRAKALYERSGYIGSQPQQAKYSLAKQV